MNADVRSALGGWPWPRRWYVYVVPGCDSWHYLPNGADCPSCLKGSWSESQLGEIRTFIEKKAFMAYHLADEFIESLDRWDHQQGTEHYHIPTENSWGDVVWVVAFHEGDAALVSPVPLNWLKAYKVGSRTVGGL